MSISINSKFDYDELIVHCMITQTVRFRQELGLPPMSDAEKDKLFKIKLWSFQCAQAHADSIIKIMKDTGNPDEFKS